MKRLFDIIEPAMGIVLFLMVLAVMVLASCTTSVPPAQVATEVPTQYRESPGESPRESPREATGEVAGTAPGDWQPARPADGSQRGRWWTVYGDTELDTLVEQAGAANPGLALALARVREARAEAGLADADRSLQVSAGLGPTRQGGYGAPDATQWRAQASFSYEVDLFGRLSDQSRAAQLDAAAQEAAYRSVLLALQADVAQQYFAIRSLDAELDVLERTVGLREAALGLARHRYEAGDTSELDVAQARTELANTQAETEAVRRARALRDHALATLLGKAPSQFTLPAAPLEVTMVTVPAGLPSALLERRPDIAQAQRKLAAASARIGAARAAFFPSLVLTGSGGYASNQLDNLFRWSSRSWLLGPYLGTALNVPLLDGGRNKAALALANGSYDEMVAGYRQQVLVGFHDVEDSLGTLRTLDRQLQFERESVAAAELATRLAQSRYRNGSASYLEVIDAERSSLAAQRAQSQIIGQRAIGSVGLIRALGGGWDGA
jgi:multidrug efflux system outer membrane protein